MRHNRKNFLSLFLAHLAFFTASHAVEIKPLTESVVVEVINEVSILTGESLSARPAEAEMLFKTPDLLQTGRRSRARLEANDGTITRVGSNTLFSFDESSRSINLKRGSLLFHSPEGKGGGRVVTASATASVLGTTIIVAATSNGGFKLLVLEGTAKVAFGDGTIYVLNAGQMTFVLPGEGKQKGRTKSNGSDQEESELAEGKPGPVLNFDLSRMLEGSFLLRGFSDLIPSQAKIDDEAEKQLSLIKSGALNSTDALIINVEDSDTIVLQELLTGNLQANKEETDQEDPDPEDPDPEDPDGNGEFDSELQRLQVAAQSTITPQSDGFPTDNFFDVPGVFVPSDLLGEVNYNEGVFYGFIAENLYFTGGELDLSPIRVIFDSSQPDYYLLGAINLIEFAGELSITGFQNSSTVEFATFGTLDFFDNISGLTINDTSSNYIGLSLSSDQGITLNTVDIENDSGHIAISTNEGDLSILNGGSLDAGASNLNQPITINPSNIYNLFNGSSFGAGSSDSSLPVEIDSPNAYDSENSIYLRGQNIMVADSVITAANKIDMLTGGQIRLDASSISANFIRLQANKIYINDTIFNETQLSTEPIDLIDLQDLDLGLIQDLDLSGLTEINIGARTLVLANVNFSSSATNLLQSEFGELAENPNTRQSPIAGFVNFFDQVTVDGNPAQDYVSVDQGGTHHSESGFPAAIQISQLGQVIGSGPESINIEQ